MMIWQVVEGLDKNYYNYDVFLLGDFLWSCTPSSQYHRFSQC